jgi:hypothetical protein
LSNFKSLSNEPTINLTISATCGDREGKKRGNPISEKCYTPNMDLSIVEFKVNSPCL